MNRREFLTGTAALAAYHSLPAPAEALSLSETLTLLGSVGNTGFNWRTGNNVGQMSTSRAGSANVYASDNSLQAVGADSPRFTYDGFSGQRLGLLAEAAQTNYAASDFAGAVVGTVGSGGALPTGWQTTNGGASATISVVSVTANTIYIRFQGSTVATMLFQFVGTTAVTCAVNDVFTFGLRAQLVSGTMPSLATIGMVERNAAGTFLNNTSVNTTPQTDILFQEEFTHTITAGARVCPYFGYSGTASPYDFTIRFDSILLVKAASIGSWLAAASGSTSTRNADNYTLSLSSLTSLTINGDASRESLTGTLLQWDDGTSNNRIELAISSSMLVLNVSVAGVVSSANLGLWIPMTRGAVALNVGASSVSAAYNGKTAVTVSALPTGMNTLRFGNGATGYWNATIGGYSLSQAAWNAATLQTNSVYGMYDDFNRANNASLGSAVTGQTYVEYDPTLNSNNQIVKMAITSNQATTAASGQTSTFSYSGIDMGSGAVIGSIGAAYTYGSTSDGPVTLISVPGGLGMVTTITARSAHVNFTGAKSVGVQIARFEGGSQVTTHTGPYDIDLAASTTYFAVAKFTSTAVICRMPDGRLSRCYDTSFSLTLGEYGTFEASRSNTSDSLAAFSAIKIDLA